MHTIGSRLRLLLAEKQLSNYAVSKMTGMSESTIGRIAKDQTVPTDTSLLMLSDKLGTNIDWLKYGVGDKSLNNSASMIFRVVEGEDRYETVLDRIGKIKTHYGLSLEEISDITGLKSGDLFQMKRREDKFNENHLRSIINSLPEVNPEWLLTGKGDMLKRSGSEQNESDKAKISNFFDLKDGERLFQYFDSKGLSIEEVSTYMNIPVHKLQAIKNGNELIDVNMSFHISRSYPDLNYEWVQTGEGRMILSTSEIKKARELREFIEGNSLSVVHSIYLTEIRKFYGKFLIVAPLVGEFDKEEYVSTWGTKYYPEISQFAVSVDSITLGNYLSVFVPDDSMDDGSSASISKRSIVLGKEIARPDWTHKSVLNKYKIFIIHTSKDILVRKIASYDPASNSFSCESYNPDKDMYPTIDIKVDEVREIFNVEVITKNL